MKKGSPDQQRSNDADLVPTSDGDTESESSLIDSEPIDVEHTEEQNLGSVFVPELKESLVFLFSIDLNFIADCYFLIQQLSMRHVPRKYFIIQITDWKL